jgi:hypothetical protein
MPEPSVEGVIPLTIFPEIVRNAFAGSLPNVLSISAFHFAIFRRSTESSTG